MRGCSRECGTPDDEAVLDEAVEAARDRRGRDRPALQARQSVEPAHHGGAGARRCRRAGRAPGGAGSSVCSELALRTVARRDPRARPSVSAVALHHAPARQPPVVAGVGRSRPAPARAPCRRPDRLPREALRILAAPSRGARPPHCAMTRRSPVARVRLRAIGLHAAETFDEPPPVAEHGSIERDQVPARARGPGGAGSTAHRGVAHDTARAGRAGRRCANGGPEPAVLSPSPWPRISPRRRGSRSSGGRGCRRGSRACRRCWPGPRCPPSPCARPARRPCCSRPARRRWM